MPRVVHVEVHATDRPRLAHSCQKREAWAGRTEHWSIGGDPDGILVGTMPSDAGAA
ncbi:MAG TPA: hypothetical protein VFZ11_03975 [Gemmatimonadaceae bacterium]